MKEKNDIAIRSSTAEYLTYIAATGDDSQSFEMRYEEENIWLTQKKLAALYDVEIPTINEHIKKIYSDRELQEDATIRKFLIVQTEGSRQVNREVKHYNLQVIISVGFKVNNERAVVQNKLHWAIHGHTAAEVIYKRADAEKKHMGLTSWKDAPNGKIQKFDVSVAKNYLSESEMVQLQRLVSAYLDIAEDMALRHIPMTMSDWETRLNRFIEATDRDVLQDAGN